LLIIRRKSAEEIQSIFGGILIIKLKQKIMVDEKLLHNVDRITLTTNLSRFSKEEDKNSEKVPKYDLTCLYRVKACKEFKFIVGLRKIYDLYDKKYEKFHMFFLDDNKKITLASTDLPDLVKLHNCEYIDQKIQKNVVNNILHNDIFCDKIYRIDNNSGDTIYEIKNFTENIRKLILNEK
jgi:hypothetical protein